MELPYRIRHRLEQLGLEQRDLTRTGQVAELQSADPRMTLSQLLQAPAGARRGRPQEPVQA